MAKSHLTTPKPLPTVTAAMAPFWQATSQGRLLIQRCSSCGAHCFPALEICSSCLSETLEWVEASGRASVFSFVVIHQAYHPGFADEIPYAVVDVLLEEGTHMISRVVDIAARDLTIGTELEVAFEQTSGSITLPVFRRSTRPRL